MQKLFRFLIVIGALLLASAQAFAISLTGEVAGTFSGAASDGSGNYSGSVSGTWSAEGALSGATPLATVSASGSFGGDGIAGNWQTKSFDPTTLSLAVNWAAADNRGPSGGTADGSVALKIDLATATASGNFTGQVYTANGLKTVTGTWNVRFVGNASSVVNARIQGSFAGTASFVGNVTGNVAGVVAVHVLNDGTVTAAATGTFNGGNITVPGAGTVCICGSWLANLVKDSNGQYKLAGAWVQPIISGTVNGSGGGGIVFNLNLATSPIQASGTFAGSSTYTVSLPILGTSNIPVASSGNWNVTLAFN